MDEVAPGVFVTTSRAYMTTSTVIVSGNDALVVDPALDPDELAALAAQIEARGWQVVAGFATHEHYDHVLWHPRLGSAPRYASPRTTELARVHHAEHLTALGEHWPAELADYVGDLQAVPDHQLPFAEPVELVVHDAHAPGHTAVWLPERRVLLAGDMLSDVELPLPFEPDDLVAYSAGLDLLTPYVAQAAVLVPGHGRPTTEPSGRLDADRRYLDAAAAGNDPDDPRRDNPGMAEVHDRIVALTRARA